MLRKLTERRQLLLAILNERLHQYKQALEAIPKDTKYLGHMQRLTDQYKRIYTLYFNASKTGKFTQTLRTNKREDKRNKRAARTLRPRGNKEKAKHESLSRV